MANVINGLFGGGSKDAPAPDHVKAGGDSGKHYLYPIELQAVARVSFSWNSYSADRLPVRTTCASMQHVLMESLN